MFGQGHGMTTYYFHMHCFVFLLFRVVYGLVRWNGSDSAR